HPSRAPARAARGGPAARRPLGAGMPRLPREKPIPERVLEELAKLKPAAALRLRIHEDRDRGASDGVIPTRVSFVQETGCVRAAAITDTATVAERTVVFDLKLVQQLGARMTDPEASVVPDLSRLLRRLLVPRDFAGVFEAGRPFVFEVDRAMARVHWEMLAASNGGEDAPLRGTAVVRRQTPTASSPAPAPPLP